MLNKMIEKLNGESVMVWIVAILFVPATIAIAYFATQFVGLAIAMMIEFFVLAMNLNSDEESEEEDGEY